MIFGLIHKIVITKPNTLKMIRSLDSNYDKYTYIWWTLTRRESYKPSSLNHTNFDYEFFVVVS